MCSYCHAVLQKSGIVDWSVMEEESVYRHRTKRNIYCTYNQNLIIGRFFWISSFSQGVNSLKNHKYGVITLLLFGIVIAMTCIVSADQVVNATPEIQSLSTVTNVDVVGITMETDAGAWSLTNDPGVNKPGSTFYDYIGAGETNMELINSMEALLEPAGGKVVWSDEGFLSVTELYVPESLLDTLIEPGSSMTFQEYGEFIANGEDPDYLFQPLNCIPWRPSHRSP